MIFFIASDLHGAAARTEKTLAAFEAEKADILLLCGDYLNHGPRNGLPEDYAPGKAAPLLNRYAEKIIGVRGNCDSEVDQMLLEFPMMGDYALVFAGERRCFLTHGHIYSPEALARREGAFPRLPAGSLFISGHTHVSVLEYREGILFLNPGSPVMPKGGSKAGYALVSEEYAALKTLEGETVKELTLQPGK
jgi:putative phosphoesterase